MISCAARSTWLPLPEEISPVDQETFRMVVAGCFFTPRDGSPEQAVIPSGELLPRRGVSMIVVGPTTNDPLQQGEEIVRIYPADIGDPHIDFFTVFLENGLRR